MTVEEAAQILKEMYIGAPNKPSGYSNSSIGIKYADDLSSLSLWQVVYQAGISTSYYTEIRKGMNLAEYVKVVNDFP